MEKVALNSKTIWLAAVLLTACQQPGETGSGSTVARFDGIGPQETVRFTGTEPFWGGEILGTRARYTTPENPDGSAFSVTRFDGNSGAGFSGLVDGQRFDLTITEGSCSDGMSDRSYPFTATLMIGAQQRRGCAWTDRQPASERHEA